MIAFIFIVLSVFSFKDRIYSTSDTTGIPLESNPGSIAKNPLRSEGCTVNFTVKPVEYSGGHDHDGNRPKGTVAPISISFSEGEVGVKTAKRCRGFSHSEFR